MYAPVSAHAVRRLSDRLVGHAMPDGGRYPCLLRLTADDALVAEARATRFVADAACAPRSGWCGFEMPGLGAAAALGDRIELRCGASGAVLKRLSAARIVASLPARRLAPEVSVEGVLDLARRTDCCDNVGPILAFAYHHIARHGRAAFVDASYRMLLGRAADPGGLSNWLRASTADRAIVREVLDALLASAEYAQRFTAAIPGPFNGNFRYDRAILDVAGRDDRAAR